MFFKVGKVSLTILCEFLCLFFVFKVGVVSLTPYLCFVFYMWFSTRLRTRFSEDGRLGVVFVVFCYNYVCYCVSCQLLFTIGLCRAKAAEGATTGEQEGC